MTNLFMGGSSMRVVYDLVWESKVDEGDFVAHRPGIFEWMSHMRRSGYLRGCGGWIDAKGALIMLRAQSYSEAHALCRRAPLKQLGKLSIVPRQLYYAA